MEYSAPFERRYFVLVIVLAETVSFMLSNLNFPSISKLVTEQFALSNAQTGLVTSFYFIPYASMQIPGGYLADRFGSARTLLVASFIMALAPLLFLTGSSFDAILASRFVAGASGGIVFPSMVRLLSQWFPRNELGKAMGLFGSANGVGQLVASSLLPLLISGINWKPPLLVTTLYSIATTILLIFPAIWTTSTISGTLARQRVWIRGLFTRNMFALMLPNFASVAVTFGSFAWASDYLISTFKVSNPTAGAIVAVIGVATIIGSFCGGISDRRLGSRKTIGVSMLLLFLFTLLFGISRSLVATIVLIFGIGFGANLYFATDFSLIPYASRQGISAAGMTFGVFNTLSNVGSVVSPVLFGIILDRTGSFSLGFGVLASIAIIGIAGAYLLSLDSLK